MTAQSLVGQTQKSGWAKKLDEPINWMGLTLNGWASARQANP